MSKYLSPESEAKITALQAAFAAVDSNEQRGVRLDEEFKKTGEQDDRGIYMIYEAAQNGLIAAQTDAMDRLGKLVVGTERQEIGQELQDNPTLNVIISAPLRTRAKIARLRADKTAVGDLLGVLSEDESLLLNSAEIVSSNRLNDELAEDTETAQAALVEVEEIQYILERPLPESSLAGETADLLKPVLKSEPTAPSAEREVNRTKPGEVRDRFVEVMSQHLGEMMTMDGIAKILHPKDHAVQPERATKRVRTMMANIFAGEMDSYAVSLQQAGVRLQRLAHRVHVENGPNTDLKQVTYEFRAFGGEVGPIEAESYTTVEGSKVIEHTWEFPEKKST